MEPTSSYSLPTNISNGSSLPCRSALEAPDLASSSVSRSDKEEAEWSVESGCRCWYRPAGSRSRCMTMRCRRACPMGDVSSTGWLPLSILLLPPPPPPSSLPPPSAMSAARRRRQRAMSNQRYVSSASSSTCVGSKAVLAALRFPACWRSFTATRAASTASTTKPMAPPMMPFLQPSLHVHVLAGFVLVLMVKEVSTLVYSVVLSRARYMSPVR